MFATAPILASPRIVALTSCFRRTASILNRQFYTLSTPLKHPIGLYSTKREASERRFFSQDFSGVYECQKCGKTYTKWQGHCYACHGWNTIVECEPPTVNRNGVNTTTKIMNPMKLSDIKSNTYSRIVLPGVEVNRVLGGGVVPGSLILIGGDPGIGKSTLMLRLCSDICEALPTNEKEKCVLYVSGEESEDQVKMRCNRLGIRNMNLYLVHENKINSILQYIYHAPERFVAVVVDSIQTIETEECASGPGSVAQIRQCTQKLLEMAKQLNVATFITGHVTKTGDLAGPRTLEHIVDTVLYLEGDSGNDTRILRSVKNRFGPTHEIGVLEMNRNGLVEKQNLYSCFLTALPTQQKNSSFMNEGSSVGIIMNGSRSLPIEFQALTYKINTQYRPSQSHCIGLSFDRLQLLLAVLKSKEKVSLGSYDVFVNVIGGLGIYDTAADLSIAMSIIGSYKHQPIPLSTCFIGEVGLAGELRPAQHLENRLKTASFLGFQQCYISYTESEVLKQNYGSMEIIVKKTLKEVIADVFDYSIC